MSKKDGQAVTLAPRVASKEDVARTLKVVDLKRRGHSYEDIAERLSIDPWVARQIVGAAHSRIATQLADEIRVEVEDRLDDLVRRLYQDLALASSQTTKNQIYALILKVESQRATLLGLNIPTGTPDEEAP